MIYHLKRLGGLTHAWGFFSGLDFFSYYRPVGFVSFAADASVWGWHAGGFHITNLVLHCVNVLLVFALARRLVTPPVAGLAAALFAAHASNQEAVYWISARFDLLATCGVLATVLLATKRQAWYVAAAMGTFVLALLSKEAALAAPILVGAYEVFISRSRVRRVVAILCLMLALIVAYSLVRSVVGGLDPTGGASRLPKAAALLAGVAALMLLARTGWERAAAAAARLRPTTAAVVGILLAAAAVVACLAGGAGTPFREKLSFAGFAGFYLFSPIVAPAAPPYFLDPATSVYWLGGVAVAALAGIAAFAGRARLFADAAWLFIVVATAGALLPVSSLTEGQRYLYMGSVPVSLGLAKAVGEAAGRWRRPAVAAAVLYLCVCAWQVQLKGADWAWATGMLSRGAALVNADLPACDQGDVVFLTAPIGVRGVYSHFYHQTFSQDGGCEPGSYRASDPDGPDGPADRRAVGIRQAPGGHGACVSRELRLVDRSPRVHGGPAVAAHARLETPLGLVTSRPEGAAQVVTIDLAPSVDLQADPDLLLRSR